MLHNQHTIRQILSEYFYLSIDNILVIQIWGRGGDSITRMITTAVGF